MVAPIVYAIVDVAISAGVWGWRIYRANEAAQTAAEVAQMAKSIAESKEHVRRILSEAIEKMTREIDVKSSTFAVVDKGGNVTASRRSGEVDQFKEYIQRKIPFRPVISVVCDLAYKFPIVVPRRVRKKISETGAEFVDVQLKQTTASVMFETIDSLLEWKSPLKAEPNYNKASRSAYLGSPSTRVKRFNDMFIFWPRPRGSLAPDIAIVEYRQEPWETKNVFAAVELKFPGDWAQAKQMDDYTALMTAPGGTASQGKQKVALMRIPEDCVDLVPDKKPDSQPSKPSNNRRR